MRIATRNSDSKNMLCLHLPLGLVKYDEAFRLQKALAAAHELGAPPDVLITLEHPPVLTVGRGADRSNILVPEELLRAEGVEVHQSTRGGDVTYHGPGQLVGYPILDLRRLGLGAAAYVHSLEQVLIDVLAGYGLSARQDPHYIGVWTGSAKVAAIGVAISRGITLHGFALNVNPNLAHFGLINPCGITDKQVTSLSVLLGRTLTVDEVRPRVVAAFARRFGLQVVAVTEAELPSWGFNSS